MYVLVHKGHVINGPKQWNYRSFENSIEEELGIVHKLPVRYSSSDIIVINEDTKIYPAAYVSQHYNTKIQKPVDGPWWDYSTGVALGSFTIGYKSAEEIKHELKSQLKELRYNKEVAGVALEFNNETIWLDTSRETRNTMVQKLTVLDNTQTVSWKFGNKFLTLNRANLSQIFSAIDTHVQSTFNWEAGLVSQIDACTTPEELDAINFDN